VVDVTTLYCNFGLALNGCHYFVTSPGTAFAQLESAMITGATAPAAFKAGQTAAKGN
jgi:hypothetical protein